MGDKSSWEVVGDMDHVVTLRPSLRRGPTALLFVSYLAILSFLVFVVPFIPSVNVFDDDGSQVTSWVLLIVFMSLIMYMYMRQVRIVVTSVEVLAGNMFFRSTTVPRQKIAYVSRDRGSGGWMAFVGHDGRSLAVVRNVWTEDQIEQLKNALGVPIRRSS